MPQTGLENSPDIVLMAGGIALCLLGWLLYWGSLHVVGAALGFGLGLALSWLVIEAAPIEQHRLTILAVACALGALLGVFVIRKIHFLAFGLVGALLGIVMGLRLAGAWAAGHPAPAGEAGGEAYNAIGAAGGALIGALAFLLLHKYIIILVTSLSGAILFDLGLPHGSKSWYAIALFAVSVVVQGGLLSKIGARKAKSD